MGRRAKPWYWEARKGWYIVIDNVKQRLADDKKTAYARFHELMSGKKTKVPSDSVAMILDRFLDDVKQHVEDGSRSQKTYEGYLYFCQSFHSALPRLRVSELRPLHVREWTNGKKTWNSTTKRSAITAVVRAFNWAVKIGHLDRSPITGMEKPEAKKRDVLVSEAEFNTLLAHASPAFRDLLIVSWETGCRPQESKPLEAKHVQLDLHRWVFAPKESKGKKKPRIVYMTPKAEEVVRRLMEKYPEGKIFRNVRGNPWTASCVQRTFVRLEKKIGKRYCQYNLRHSFGNRMLTERRLDSLVVAELMGHSSTQMLATTYSHLNANPDHLLKAVGASEPENKPEPSVAPDQNGKTQGRRKRRPQQSG